MSYDINKSTAVAAGNMFPDRVFLGLEALNANATAPAPAPATVPPLFEDYGTTKNGFDFLSETSVSML